MEPYSSKDNKRCNYLIGETNAVYHDMAVKMGLSDSAMNILYTICDSGESCLLKEICRRSGISKQTVNSAIRKLEQEGMVYLKSADSRNKYVCLTNRGKELSQNTVIRMIQAENEIFASWPKEEVDIYLELTEKYLRDLREKAKDF
ncbi:MAG: MarR family transcriptional regulator [Lachnospiraceae bacterium]|nr:MarR family transcriptional regulator [Lachnospiraceae bacterium]MDE6982356.1 MarR family transcriptional regulator [Lachnospiraceae bacterium]